MENRPYDMPVYFEEENTYSSVDEYGTDTTEQENIQNAINDIDEKIIANNKRKRIQ